MFVSFHPVSFLLGMEKLKDLNCNYSPNCKHEDSGHNYSHKRSVLDHPWDPFSVVGNFKLGNFALEGLCDDVDVLVF
jgi:hypothetical protein